MSGKVGAKVSKRAEKRNKKQETKEERRKTKKRKAYEKINGLSATKIDAILCLCSIFKSKHFYILFDEFNLFTMSLFKERN